MALLNREACSLGPYKCLVMRDRFLTGGRGADLDPSLKFMMHFTPNPQFDYLLTAFASLIQSSIYIGSSPLPIVLNKLNLGLQD